MKKTLLMAALAFSVAFVACKKEEEQPKPKTTKEKITGKWKGDKTNVAIALPPPIGNQTFDEDMSYANYDFRADGTLVVDSAGVSSETSTWTVVDDNTITIDGENLQIKLLNDTQFHMGLDTVIDFMGIPANASITIQLKK